MTRSDPALVFFGLCEREDADVVLGVSPDFFESFRTNCPDLAELTKTDDLLFFAMPCPPKSLIQKRP